MNTGVTCGIMMLIIAVPAAAFAQTDTLITVQTDDNIYDEGDTVVISGQVSTVVGETPVLLQLFSSGNLVHVDQIQVAQDGSYSYSLIAEGRYWIQESEYLVKVAYGDVKIETQFNYYPKTEAVESTDIFEVSDGSSGTFDVAYTIKGGTVTGMQLDQRGLALVAEIESTDDGSITLDLPRIAIDAKNQQQEDIDFIILIDDMPVDYEESNTGTSRAVTVNFEQGDTAIRIIGTFVIPEFGALAMVALAGTAAAAILITRAGSTLFPRRLQKNTFP